MRANYEIPREQRCPNCKGWGTVFTATGSRAEPPASYNHGLPLGHDDLTRCWYCAGSGHRPEDRP